MKIRKPGYYVEDRYYGFSIAQAFARAAHLTREFGREVRVRYVSSAGVEEIVTRRESA